MRDKILKQPGKLIRERQIDLEVHPGWELVSEFKDFLTITRILLVKNRLYFLTVSLNTPQRANANVALASFNSFHLLSPAAIDAEVRKAIAGFAPQPLPQEPFVKRPTTDWEDEGLKGRVREFVVESKDDWPGAALERYVLSEVEFNEQGDRLREIKYRSGVPSIAIAYGYLKGKRVATLTAKPLHFVLVSDDGVSPIKNETPEKLITDSLKFEYKYSNTGKLIERLIVRSDGREYERVVRDLTKNKIEVTSGLNAPKMTYFLDDKGNTVERRFVRSESESYSNVFDTHVVQGERVSYSTVRETYTYEFDSQGNWIKQIVLRLEKKDGKIISVPYRTTYRRITYF